MIKVLSRNSAVLAYDIKSRPEGCFSIQLNLFYKNSHEVLYRPFFGHKRFLNFYICLSLLSEAYEIAIKSGLTGFNLLLTDL